MIRVSLHSSPKPTDLAGSRGLITSRETMGIDEAAEALEKAGLEVCIVEGPAGEAPESDFWFVLADELDWHIESLAKLPGASTNRFVIIRPGRDRAFVMLEELDAAATVEAWGHEWAEPAGGRLAVRREVATPLGGRLGIRFPYFKETERHASWEHPDLSTLAQHVAKYLEAVGSRTS